MFKEKFYNENLLKEINIEIYTKFMQKYGLSKIYKNEK